MTTTLYRIFGKVDNRDKDGLGQVGTALLYVGITDDYTRRISQHSEKHWFQDVTKITRQEFDDRSEAAIAERKAIETERPLHNRAMNAAPPNTRPPAPKAWKHPERDPLLSLAESADYLGVCTKTLRRYIAAGDVSALRVRGSRLIRIRQSALDSLLHPIPTVRN